MGHAGGSVCLIKILPMDSMDRNISLRKYLWEHSQNISVSFLIGKI